MSKENDINIRKDYYDKKNKTKYGQSQTAGIDEDVL